MAKILVADDNLNHLGLLRAHLEGMGHDVSEAIDGYTAVEHALNETPDMVILGYALPIFNGLETCEILRRDPSLPAHTPIVLLAAQAIDARVLEKAGISATLSPSHTHADLREFISKLLGPEAA